MVMESQERCSVKSQEPLLQELTMSFLVATRQNEQAPLLSLLQELTMSFLVATRQNEQTPLLSLLQEFV